MPRKTPAKKAVKKATKRATKTPAKKAAKLSGKLPRTPESTRCSDLQHRIANRARLVLSLCDQVYESPLSLPVVAKGMSEYLDAEDYQEHSMVSRLLRAHRNWRPEQILALAKYARKVHRVVVDAGWLAYGSAYTGAPAPVIPSDCELRDNTDLDGLERSKHSLGELMRQHRSGKQ